MLIIMKLAFSLPPLFMLTYWALVHSNCLSSFLDRLIHTSSLKLWLEHYAKLEDLFYQMVCNQFWVLFIIFWWRQ